ncbi:Cytochrome P450 71D10 [Vitis vinifera]|uniref:Sesquiterpene oxidase n=3 Tax=Vitis vinifera TaxID=29760 RepID=A0A0S3QPS9_VITVI|nr:Cytochrome P450 71D10 [Vitis vinifera]BAT70340.1 sesquiterpene oxidase [Vitis vinifera]
MEFFSSSLLFAFLLFLYMLYKIAKRSKDNISTQKLPPGPWKLPLIGNVHQLVGSLPHRSLTFLAKKYGPLMRLQLGEVSTLIVSSPEMAKQVMKTHDTNFAQRPILLATRILSYDCSGVAFAPYGDYWRQLRKICVVELLTAKRVKSFQSVREEEISNLITMVTSCSRLQINFTEKISSLTFSIIARAAFGKKSEDQDAFLSVMKELVETASGFCVADMYPSVKWLDLISGMRYKIDKVFRMTDRILQNIVDEHREKLKTQSGKLEGEADLVDVLLKLQQNGDLQFALTDNNIKAVILDIFGGAGESTSTSVEWAMSEMLKAPIVMEKAQAEVRSVFDGKGHVDETAIDELKFLKAVVNETLRLHPPFPLLLPRECREMCKINGYEIPEKTRIIVNAWAIGRDSDYWVEAERFYPERFLDSSIDYKGTDFGYIPFGAGRRICPGILFAMPGIELPLANLLYHFDWKLPNGMKAEDLDMTEAFGLAVRRKQDLHLIPIPYNPSHAD